MCRRLSAMTVLSYSLRERSSVSSAFLLEKREELIREMGDVLADVSFVSIRRVTHAYCDTVELKTSGTRFSVVRKRVEGGCGGVTARNLFDDRYLDACLRPYFTPKEREGIRKLLQG